MTQVLAAVVLLGGTLSGVAPPDNLACRGPREPRLMDTHPPTWGPAVANKRAALVTALRYRPGSYLEAEVYVDQPQPTPPYLRLVDDRLASRYDSRPVQFDLTDAAGQVVPITRQTVGFADGGGGTWLRVRFRPPADSPGWPYFPSGRYRLTAAVTAQVNRFDSIAWTGRLATRPAEFEIAGEPVRGYSPQEAVAVLTGLAEADPAVRLVATARADATPGSDGLAAAVGGVFVPADVVRHPLSVSDVLWQLLKNDDWTDAVGSAGPSAIGPILALAGPNSPYALRESITRLLALTGHDPRSRDYLIRLATTGDWHDQSNAMQTLGQLGPKAVPDLVRFARDPRCLARRSAVEALAMAGTAETVGPLLVELLRVVPPNTPGSNGLPDEVCGSAAVLAEELRVTAVVPELRALATGERPAGRHLENNARRECLRAYAALADPADARAVLRRLITSNDPHLRGVSAELLKGIGDR